MPKVIGPEFEPKQNKIDPGYRMQTHQSPLAMDFQQLNIPNISQYWQSHQPHSHHLRRKQAKAITLNFWKHVKTLIFQNKQQ